MRRFTYKYYLNSSFDPTIFRKRDGSKMLKDYNTKSGKWLIWSYNMDTLANLSDYEEVSLAEVIKRYPNVPIKDLI